MAGRWVKCLSAKASSNSAQVERFCNVPPPRTEKENLAADWSTRPRNSSSRRAHAVDGVQSG